MSYSSEEVVNKLKEWGERIGFKVFNEYRVRLPKIRRNLAYVDCVWFTKKPVEIPVIGFEISVKGGEFSNFKKMKGDLMNLKLLSPRIGILVVNEREAEHISETWYQKVSTYKEALEMMASPMPLKFIDISDIMDDKVHWRELLKEIGLKLIQ